jgi:hypothetical protein
MAIFGQATTTTMADTVLHGGAATWSVVVIVFFVLLAGLVVIAGRSSLEGKAGKDKAKDRTETKDLTAPVHGRGSSADRTLIRSWIAISLVSGLLIFCAVIFAIDDPSLRSSLIGGLVASAGAAVAFYFAFRSADQARQDILNASRGTVMVPNRVRKAVSEPKALLGVMPLLLQIDPPSSCRQRERPYRWHCSRESVVKGVQCPKQSS